MRPNPLIGGKTSCRRSALGGLLLVVTLMGAGISACVHSAESKGQDAGVERALMWKVTSEDASFHLLGTIHKGVAAEELPPSVWRAFESHSCFVMEADDSGASARELLAMALAPEASPLNERLDESAWKRLKKALEERIPPRLLKKTKPWFAVLLYVQQLYPSGQAMDTALLKKARGADKDLRYLETWREAVNAFSKATTLKDLKDLLDDKEGFLQETERLVEAYREGDLSGIEQAFVELNARSKADRKKVRLLLRERNRTWLPRLIEHVKGGDCFVAVGAGHMTGESSLLDLLRDEGFTVKRMDGGEDEA